VYHVSGGRLLRPEGAVIHGIVYKRRRITSGCGTLTKGTKKGIPVGLVIPVPYSGDTLRSSNLRLCGRYLVMAYGKDSGSEAIGSDADEYGSDEGKYPSAHESVGAFKVFQGGTKLRQPTDQDRMRRRPTTTGSSVATEPSALHHRSTQRGTVPRQTEQNDHKGKKRRERRAEHKADEGDDRISDGVGDTHIRRGELRTDKRQTDVNGGRVRIPDDPRDSAGAAVRHLEDWLYISPTDISPGGDIYMTDGRPAQLRFAVSSCADEDLADNGVITCVLLWASKSGVITHGGRNWK